MNPQTVRLEIVLTAEQYDCLVGEIKFTELSSSEKSNLLSDLKKKKNLTPHFKIFDLTTDL